MNKMEQILKTFGSTFLSLKEFGFAYGFQGNLFRRNFEKFWFAECVTAFTQYNVFHLQSNTLMASLKDLTDVGLTQPPFGIVEIDDVKNTWNQSLLPVNTKPITHKIAKVTTFYEDDDSIGNIKDLFYKKQRERKSWWRRISQNPSIYYMTETKKERNKEYVEIQAQFPFGNIVVETILFKKNAKKMLPGVEGAADLRIVEHITSLDWGCVTLLCDGFREIEGSKELHMHSRLLPYKAYCKAIIAPDADETTKEDLHDLTLYIIELLREQGVESIIMNHAKKPEVLRVPYIITVDSESLKNGLVKVVSQVTLCGEIVHITNLAKHMYELCV